MSRWTPPAIPSTKGELLHWIGESEVSQYYKMFFPRYFHPELLLKMMSNGSPHPFIWKVLTTLQLFTIVMHTGVTEGLRKVGR